MPPVIDSRIEHVGHGLPCAGLEEHGLLASAQNPKPRAPTASELAQLPFLNAIFHEGLRVVSPASSGSLRRLAEDTDVCGTLLPKGALNLPVCSCLHCCSLSCLHSQRMDAELDTSR